MLIFALSSSLFLSWKWWWGTFLSYAVPRLWVGPRPFYSPLPKAPWELMMVVLLIINVKGSVGDSGVG